MAKNGSLVLKVKKYLSEADEFRSVYQPNGKCVLENGECPYCGNCRAHIASYLFERENHLMVVGFQHKGSDNQRGIRAICSDYVNMGNGERELLDEHFFVPIELSKKPTNEEIEFMEALCDEANESARKHGQTGLMNKTSAVKHNLHRL
ncbi:MAG: hypothetical protein ABIF08_03635 [Nanoarchaeota archaeon]